MSYSINAIENTDDEQFPLSKKRKVSNETYMWHLRLGHINSSRIHGLVKSGILNSLIFEPIPVCESCLEGKMTKRPFKAKGIVPLYSWNWYTLMYEYFKPEADMSISSHLLMTTQDMVMFT